MTVQELFKKIHDDHFSHLDFMENMNGGDCDCNIHNALYLMHEYWEVSNA